MATRREKVVLELEDGGFSTQMAKDAAATMLLERALKSLDGTTVNIHERISESATQVDRLSRSARDADGSINQLTGRLRVFAEVGAVGVHALTPLGGVVTAGVAGLSAQIGFAAVAGGVLIGSMHGLGDALAAIQKAHLEPTNKNLEAMHAALRRLSPAARDFAKQAYDMVPALKAIRDMGAEELFPGLSDSLNSLERLGPQVGGIFEAVAGALGDIASDSASSLASERWEDFFTFIREEAPRAVKELATTVGDLTHGLSELWQAFTPLNNDFSSWLMDAADGFDRWATGLSQTAGFQNFIDYIRTTGPQVQDTLGALANALIQIVQASAPLGGPVLAGIEAVADAIATVADSDLGTPILVAAGALSLLNRALAVTASLSKVSLSSGLFAGVGTLLAGPQSGSTGALGQLRAMPAALREATAAQQGLVAAQKRASAVTAQYVGQLQAVNSATARGFKPSMQTLDRLTDSLDQVHLANRDVETATTRAATAEEKRRSALRTSASQLGKTAALVGGLAIASSGAADQIGLTNTMSLALAGSIAGPLGVALGAGAGLFLDWRAAGAAAEAQWRAFQATLEGKSLDELNEQLAVTKGLQAALGDDTLLAGGIVDKQVGLIEDQIAAVEELEQAREDERREAAMSYAEQVGLHLKTSKLARMSTEDIKAQADALKALQDAARETAESFLGLPDSLNKGKVSLSKFITQMQKSADALVNFNSNSVQAVKNGLDQGLVESLRAAGEEGALRMKQLANASESEIKRANRAYRSQQKALEQTITVTEKLAGLSPIKVDVNVKTGAAETNIRSLEAHLRAIDDENVYINLRHRQYGKDTGYGPQNDFFSGGYTGPGHRLEPRGVVHAGEVVIPQDLARRDWPMLSARYGHLPGFADGGVVNYMTTTPTPAVPSGWARQSARYPTAPARTQAAAAIDYDRLIGGLAQEFRDASAEASEAVGRGIARESGRGWTEQSRRTRAAGHGGFRR